MFSLKGYEVELLQRVVALHNELLVNFLRIDCQNLLPKEELLVCRVKNCFGLSFFCVISSSSIAASSRDTLQVWNFSGERKKNKKISR